MGEGAFVGTADLHTGEKFIEPSERRDGIGEEFERAEDGDIGQAGGMPGTASAEGGDIACAQGVGNVARGGDEKDMQGGEALSELGANKLVATPDVIPVFKRDKDQKTPVSTNRRLRPP